MKKTVLGCLMLYTIAGSLSYPSAYNENHFENRRSVKMESNLNALEQSLENQGTSIEEETNKEILYYQKLRETISEPGTKAKIDSLIETLQDLPVLNRSDSSIRKSIANDFQISLVNAVFNSMGYKLSSELLLHAKANKNIDSVYLPVNASLILESEKIREIENGSTLSGTAVFPKTGNTNDNDLYYAIRGFNYEPYPIFGPTR